jgi:hypothetical protein
MLLICGSFLMFSAMPYASAQINTFPYFEDFESGQGGWVASGIDVSWSFGTPAKAIIQGAASGSNAWVNGGLRATYPNDEISQMLGPVFNFSGLSAPRISLKIWWQTEFSWDGAVLQSSINNGTSWQNVGTAGDPNNWYNDNAIFANPGGQPQGWAGASSGYVTACHPLTGLGGRPNVLLRIAFASDTIIPGEGVAFDDIRIQQSAAQEIDIQRPALTSIPNNGSDLQSNQAFNNTVNLTYTLVNQTPCSDLAVSNVTVQNPSNVSATVTRMPVSPVIGPGNTTFAVEYKVAAIGAFSFGLAITNDDANENPYTFTVRGTGVAASLSEIDVQRPAGTSISSGSNDPQGNQIIGTPIVLSYTVANRGSANLAVSGVTVQNPSNVRATITQTPGSPIAGPGSTTFAIRYRITAAGAFSFNLAIANNDSDENPYIITVSGTGIVDRDKIFEDDFD